MKEGECVTEMKMEEKETYVRRERERERALLRVEIKNKMGNKEKSFMLDLLGLRYLLQGGHRASCMMNNQLHNTCVLYLLYIKKCT